MNLELEYMISCEVDFMSFQIYEDQEYSEFSWIHLIIISNKTFENEVKLTRVIFPDSATINTIRMSLLTGLQLYLNNV